MTSTPSGEKPKAEPLADPQARCLMATGEEARALEAEWQAHLKSIWSAEFNQKMDDMVAKAISRCRC